MSDDTDTRRPQRQTVFNRYQACCTICGSLDYFSKKSDAIRCAERHGYKMTSVWDAMVHKGQLAIVWERAT